MGIVDIALGYFNSGYIANTRTIWPWEIVWLLTALPQQKGKPDIFVFIWTSFIQWNCQIIKKIIHFSKKSYTEDKNVLV